jgi:hypothetical protein
LSKVRHRPSPLPWVSDFNNPPPPIRLSLAGKLTGVIRGPVMAAP